MTAVFERIDEIIADLDFELLVETPDVAPPVVESWQDGVKKFAWCPGAYDPVADAARVVAEREQQSKLEQQAQQQARERVRQERIHELVMLATEVLGAGYTTREIEALSDDQLLVQLDMLRDLRVSRRYRDFMGRSQYCFCSPSRGAYFTYGGTYR